MVLRQGFAGIACVALVLSITLGQVTYSETQAGISTSEIETIAQKAEQGDVLYQTGLGAIYDDGIGIPQDYQQAYYWYRKAAIQGHARAQFLLGGMYADGRGISQDYQQARHWYEKAANQGDTEAQYALSKVYALGKGVSIDYPTAYMWINLAAAKNQAYIKIRDLIVKEIPSTEVEEGQRLTREWLAQHPNLNH